MSIIDIGILTGFKPEQKSLRKVTVTMIATLLHKDKCHFFVSNSLIFHNENTKEIDV